MPWVQCANPQKLLDLALMLTGSPLINAQDNGSEVIQSGNDGGIAGGRACVQSAQTHVRLKRAWAISSDDAQQVNNMTDLGCSTAATSDASGATMVTQTSHSCTGREDTPDADVGSILAAALSQARAEAELRGAVATVVCGSLYLVGDFLRLVETRNTM